MQRELDHVGRFLFPDRARGGLPDRGSGTRWDDEDAPDGEPELGSFDGPSFGADRAGERTASDDQIEIEDLLARVRQGLAQGATSPVVQGSEPIARKLTCLRAELSFAERKAHIGATLPEFRSRGKVTRFGMRIAGRVILSASRVVTVFQTQFNLALVQWLRGLAHCMHDQERALSQMHEDLSRYHEEMLEMRRELARLQALVDARASSDAVSLTVVRADELESCA